MKLRNKFIRLLSVCLAAVIGIPACIGGIGVSASEMADEWAKIPSESPPEVEADVWYQPTAFRGYEKNGRYLTVKTVVNGLAAELYLSFPSLGGFRFQNTVPPTEPESVEKTAIFEPDSNIKINYETVGGSLIMVGADGTSVAFKTVSNSWEMDVSSSDGTHIMTIDPSCIFFGYANGELCRVKLELPLSYDEVIYGTGERYSGVNQNGKRSMMWNCDACYHGSTIGADGIEELWRGYKNIPILHSNKGYTLFYNSTCCAEVDIGYTDETKYTMDFCENRLDFYFWSGTMSENIVKYTDLTGKSYLPPKWAFQYQAGGSNGFWGNNKTDEYQLEQANKLIAAYEAMETPLHTVYLEGVNLLGEDNGVAELFSNAGVRMLKWNCGDTVPLDEAQELLPDVEYSQLPILRNPDNGFSGRWIDFFDDKGIELLTLYLEKYTDIGIQGGMLDFAELITKSATSPSNGLNGTRLHNFYTYGYAKGYNIAYNTLTDGQGFFYIRGASAGTQQYAALWAGDQYSSWAGLKMQLSAGLSAASCGFSIWGTDLSGLDGTPTDELYCRALMMGAFSPIMRTGGNISKLPTDYGTSVQNTYKKAYWLRENLLNKLYSSAVDSHTSGLPMMQAMAIAFPEDTSLAAIEEQYLFCDDFLVSPVLGEGVTSIDVALPSGMWYDLWSGEELSGGVTVNAAADTESIPVYVKSGAAVPLTLNSQLALGEKITSGEQVEALLVTPPESERTSVYNIDEENSVSYKSLPLSDGSFMLTSSQGNAAECLSVFGKALTGVTVDGKQLSQLTEKPDSTDTVGYYVESDSKTLVYIGTSDWANIVLCYESEYSGMTAADFKASQRTYFGAALSSLTEYEVSAYYDVTEENGATVFTRNSQSAATNLLYKKNIAFIYGGKYENFTLDFDFAFNSALGSKQQIIWITLGNETCTDPTGSVLLGIKINKYSSEASCELLCMGDSTATFDVGSFDATALHHVRVTVADKNISVFIDDQTVIGTELDADYSGGYVGFGCNYAGTSVSSVTLDGTGGAYFGSSGNSDIRTYCDVTDYYEVSATETGKRYVFTGDTGSSWTNGAAMLNLGKYKNFTLEFDYTHVGSGERYLWLNWGLDDCRTYNPQNGAARLGIGARDNTLQNGFLNCIYTDTVSAWFDGSNVGWLDSNGTLNGSFDATASHHVSLTARDGYITIEFDNGALVKRRAWHSSYHGGYVMIGANYSDTVIENISLTDYDGVPYTCVYGEPDGAKSYSVAGEFYTAAVGGNTVIRNGSYTDGVPFLCLGEGDEIILDFELAFTDAALGEQWARICYGSDTPTSYDASSGGSVSIGITEYSLDENVTCYVSAGGEKTELCSIDKAEILSIMFVISGDRLFVRVGESSASVSLEGYSGGYVLLGAESTGIMLSDISLNTAGTSGSVYVTDGSVSGEKTALCTEAMYNISEDGAEFVRNNISPMSNLSDGSAAYIPIGFAENFCLEFDYYFPDDTTDRNYVWLTVGADSDTAEVGSGGSEVIGIGNNKYAQLCKFNQDSRWTYIGSYAEDGTHHVKLSLIDGVINVKIDGSLKNRVSLMQGYEGGYVLLGLNSAYAAVSDIYFESLDTADFEDFSAYFTTDLENTAPAAEQVGEHWRYDSNTASLERNGINYYNNGTTQNIAILYFNKKQYYDFDLMLDYKVTDQGGLYIGMGTSMGESWMGDSGSGYAVYLKSNGTVVFGPQAEYLQGSSEEYGITLSDCGTLFSTSADRHSLHTCKISVRSGTATVYIDGNCQGSAELYGYEGGYISLAANSEFVRFKNFEVVDGYSALTLSELKRALLSGREPQIFDYNEDTFVNIMDLIRLKKLIAGVY